MQFLRDLAILSTLFVRKDSKYFNDKKAINFIEQNLRKFLEKIYNENEGEYANWWHWEIGYPLEIMDILLLLDEKLDSNLVKKALEVTKFFQPDPQYSGMNPRAIHPRMPALRITTGGNRVDTVKISLIRGILLKDLSEVKRAISILPEVWKTKSSILKDDGESRDGFYEDGSFLQHGSIPYTGTYGNVLLKGVAEILFILNGSFLEEELKNVEEMYENVLKAFEPLFFKGGISDFVSGRAIARKDHWDQKIGCEILKSITLLSKSASPKYKKVFLKIIERETDKKKKYKREIYCFNAMERIFLRDRNHAFGIALHSKKIGNYESMNGENTQGWFTGDGA
ncbi:MAG: polysaccharide lyase family 8 super-sandwich domain-containing protein, partial [Fusobacteriaceae bacterium]